MIWVSEAVLPGHPDKLCDFVAESLVQAVLMVDPDAYAQIEAGIWCDQLWLSGGYAARGEPLDVVHIATPVCDIAALTIAAARAGKHIVMGKPMAMTMVSASSAQ